MASYIKSFRYQLPSCLDSPTGFYRSTGIAHAETPANSPVTPVTLDFSDCMDFSEYGADPTQLSFLSDSSLSSDSLSISSDDDSNQSSCSAKSNTSRIPRRTKAGSSIDFSDHSLSKSPVFASRIPVLIKKKLATDRIVISNKPLSSEISSAHKSKPAIIKQTFEHDQVRNQTIKSESDNVLETSLGTSHKLTTPDSSPIHIQQNSARISMVSPHSSPLSFTAQQHKAVTLLYAPMSIETALRLDDLDLTLLHSPVVAAPRHQQCPADLNNSIHQLNSIMRHRHIRRLEEKFDRACEEITRLNRRIEQVQARCQHSVSHEHKPVPKALKVFLTTMRDARDAFLLYAQQAEEEISACYSDNDGDESD